MKDMKRLFGYMGPYKKDMILGALFVMIETGFELFIPIMISNLIDIGVANHDVNYIYVKGVQMALLALGALVTGLLYAHFQQRLIWMGCRDSKGRICKSTAVCIF